MCPEPRDMYLLCSRNMCTKGRKRIKFAAGVNLPTELTRQTHRHMYLNVAVLHDPNYVLISASMHKTDLLIFSLFAISIKRKLVIIVKCQHDPFIVLTTLSLLVTQEGYTMGDSRVHSLFKNIPTVGKLH